MINKKTNLALSLLLALFSSLLSAETVNLYSLKEPWRQDQGKPIAFSGFSGKKLVLAMAYTSCKGACPVIVKKMEKIEDLLAKKNVTAEFLLVSFDPSHDSPEMLADFRKHMGIRSEHWHLLTGTEAQTRMLGNLLNIHFAKLPASGEISHDNKIVLLDGKGDLVRTIEGLGEPLDKLFE